MSLTPHRRRLGAALALVLGVVLVPPLAAPAAAAARPDLRVKTVVADATEVARGGTVAVTAKVVNAGRRKAAASQVRFHLSKDGRLGRSDTPVGSRGVPALKPGARRTASTTITVPDRTKPGGWYLLACADAGKEVAEANEDDNCRATRRKLAVTRPADTPTFPVEPDPLSVDSTLQTARAVTETAWPHQATSIRATAADGTEYTLDVPAGSLLGQEDITLTPVASVDGLPLSGGMVAAVQVEPHGLMLLEPATLTIESPDAGPLARQTGFLFHEDGEDLHPYPMDAPVAGDDEDVVRMTLTHFSTPGVGSGSDAERADLASHAPSRAQSQVAAAISALISTERASQLSGADPDPAVAQQVEGLMNQFYDDVVRQRLAAAETDKALAAEAISLALGWSRQMLLLGDEDNPRHDEVMRRVERILRNVLDQSWEECLDHDLRASLDLLRVARTAALLSYSWDQEAADKAFGCARFEVRMDSVVDYRTRWSGNHQNGTTEGHWHTEGAVTTHPLSADNQGPLTWAGFRYASQNTITDPGSTCRTSEVGTSTAPGSLRAVAVPVTGSLNVREGAPVTPPVPVTSFVSEVGDARPTETYQYTSCDGSTSTETDSRWSAYFESPEAWTTDPGAQQDDLLDSKTFRTSDVGPDTSVIQETTVEVWHKPSL